MLIHEALMMQQGMKANDNDTHPPSEIPVAMSGAFGYLLWMCSIASSKSSLFAAQYVRAVCWGGTEQCIIILFYYISRL